MKITGQILKETRERQNLSVSEVSMATKISPRIIEDIEAGRMDCLPPVPFTRGFVRSYAKFLQLDGETVIKSFNDELGWSNEVTKAPPPEASKKPEEASFWTKIPWTNALVTAGILALILIIVSVNRIVEKYQNEKSTTPPPIVSTPASEPSEPAPPLPALTEAPSTEGQPVDPPVASPVAITPAPTPEAPPPAPPPKPVGSHEIIVEALDSVSIQFRVDGGSLQRVSLAPEQVHRIKGNEKISIDVSDGGAVSIVYNGVDRGVPGNLGQPIKIVYPIPEKPSP